jgi:cold shock CspA family protein
MNKRHKGQVSFFNESKAFGFIRFGEQESVFFHIRDFAQETEKDDVKKFDWLTFEVGPDPRSGRTKAMRIEFADDDRVSPARSLSKEVGDEFEEAADRVGLDRFVSTR